MADEGTKLSPHLDIRKKRSVQFLVDCRMGDCQSVAGSGDPAGYQPSHEGDNLSTRSLGSAASPSSRHAGCSVRCATPRVCSSSGVVDSGEEGEDGCPISISRPTDAPVDLAVFEVGLGMLRQHTIYEVQFLLPAACRLSVEEVEVIRSNVVAPGDGKHFERSAEVEVKLIDYLREASVYKLTLKVTTNASSHVCESFALRETDHTDRCVYFILCGSALGRGYGTPSLRLGIHQIGHTSEYEGSDAKTEWAGFDDPEPGAAAD